MASIVIPVEQATDDLHWLRQQSVPVIAYGDGGSETADVVVADQKAAEAIAARADKWPQAAQVLVQVLRASESLPVESALDVESLAYATLQGGGEFAAWRHSQPAEEIPQDQDGEPVLISRRGNILEAQLNRPALRNSMTVAMREGWMTALSVLEADDSISELQFSGRGSCFSVGGELREFGSAPDVATAHWVRSVHSPARKVHALRERICFYVHGACLGSGVELPAFASRVVAHPKSFFQLPELQLGLVPGAGGTVSIARRIGRQRTAWMVLSGRRINARTALEWGLVDALSEF